MGDSDLNREFARVMMEARFDRSSKLQRYVIDRPNGREVVIWRPALDWDGDFAIEGNQSPFSEAAGNLIRTNGDTLEDRRSFDGFNVSHGKEDNDD